MGSNKNGKKIQKYVHVVVEDGFHKHGFSTWMLKKMQRSN